MRNEALATGTHLNIVGRNNMSCKIPYPHEFGEYKCEGCHPELRAERKALFIARATKRFDTPRIRKEAAELFEAKNK